MVGEKLTKALSWFEKAVLMEREGKESMMTRALDMAIKLEKEGIEPGKVGIKSHSNVCQYRTTVFFYEK